MTYIDPKKTAALILDLDLHRARQREFSDALARADAERATGQHRMLEEMQSMLNGNVKVVGSVDRSSGEVPFPTKAPATGYKWQRFGHGIFVQALAEPESVNSTASGVSIGGEGLE